MPTSSAAAMRAKSSTVSRTRSVIRSETHIGLTFSALASAAWFILRRPSVALISMITSDASADSARATVVVVMRIAYAVRTKNGSPCGLFVRVVDSVREMRMLSA